MRLGGLEKAVVTVLMPFYLLGGDSQMYMPPDGSLSVINNPQEYVLSDTSSALLIAGSESPIPDRKPQDDSPKPYSEAAFYGMNNNGLRREE